MAYLDWKACDRLGVRKALRHDHQTDGETCNYISLNQEGKEKERKGKEKGKERKVRHWDGRYCEGNLRIKQDMFRTVLWLQGIAKERTRRAEYLTTQNMV